MNPSTSESDRKAVELLAYELWEQRGRPAGSPDGDWLRAEQEYYRADAITEELPYSSVAMKANG
jgi:Protein of unknown function (DUF2934)